MKTKVHVMMMLLATALLVCGMSVDAFAQCCGGGGKGAAAAAGGGCPNGQCPKQRAAEAERKAEEVRLAAETAANAINWRNATTTDEPAQAANTGDGASSDNAAATDNANKIAEIEDAKSAASKLIIVYCCVDSEDPRQARFVEACKPFEAEVLRAIQVSQALETGVECIRVNMANCSREVRREYGLRHAPEVLIFDVTGKKLASYSGNDVATLSKLIAAAKERNEKVIQKLQDDQNKG